MKKLGRLLTTLALSAPLLGGCSLLDMFSNLPEETKDVKGLELRDFTASVTLNSKYNFDGKVYINYTDNTDKEITSYCTFSSVDTSKVGKTDFRVDYETKSKIYYTVTSISVYDPNAKSKLESISVSNYTDTVEKGAQYTFDGKVYAKYEGIANPILVNNSDCSIGTISTTSTGTKSLSISFTDTYQDASGTERSVTKSTSASINVIAKPTAISASDIEVGVNQTKDIRVTFTPSDTTETDVSYVSNNPSVATVDANGKVKGLLQGQSTTITITSKAAPSVSKTININVTEATDETYTVLIYMCGADLESGWDAQSRQYYDSYAASMDLDEIKSVRNQPDNVNIVVEAGGAKRWKTSYQSIIDKNKLNRFHLENGSYVLDEQISNASMGKASTLQSFLEWGIENYYADKMALIFWDHGGGMHGCCYDELYDDDALLDSEVVEAVSGAFSKKGISQFEWVGYDCCLMQTMEVAEFNSPYFKYMVASQESENGYGWDYTGWVDDLYRGEDTETLLTEIVDTFIDYYGGVNASGGYYDGQYYAADQTLSFLDLSKIGAFKSAWESCASATVSKITSSNKSQFKNNILEKIQHFAGSDYDYFAVFDAMDYLIKLGSNSTFNPGGTYVSDAKTALDDLIVYNLAQKEASGDAHGLSFYFGDDYSSSTYSHFSNWISLVNKVGAYSYSFY